MVTSHNPFTPNFGQIPLHIAGRRTIIADILSAMDDGSGNPSRTSIFVGARGSGKTALLSYFAAESRSRGWINVNVTCIDGMQDDILQQTIYAASELLPPESTRRLKGFSLGQLVSMEWDNVNAVESNWRSKMTAILDELSRSDAGLLMTIDEVSPQLNEMIQVASIYQLWLRENRKVSLLMAGLPSEVSALLNDRTVSFLRRASRYNLERIDNYEIEEAFVDTVKDSGKSISSDALTMAVDAIDGFPYMMQLIGYRTWEHAADKECIDTDDVKRGISMAARDFESRVLQATVSELSSGDIAFLNAMLPDDEESEISDVQARLQRSSGYVSRYRARLLERGVIETRGRGRISFALPGLKEYLRS